VLDRHPRDTTALAALVRLHADVRQFPRAIELAKRLARDEGRDERADEARLLAESAAAAHAEGRTDDARRALAKALRRDPQAAAAWVELGALEAERGRPKRALAAWRKVPGIDRRRAEQVYPRLEATFAALGRTREFESGLTPLRARRALAAWAWLARRPGWYRRVTGPAMRILGALGRRRGAIRTLPLAGGWTSVRDLPVPKPLETPLTSR